MTTDTAGTRLTAPLSETSADVSPESIAALVAQGAASLRLPELPALSPTPDAAPALGAEDALELLVGVTHDMRSPLSSILVLLERLRTGQAGPVTPAQERQLGLLYSAAFGLAAMSNDALDFARGTARLAAADPVPFSIGDLLRSVRQLVQPIAEEKGLVLRCSGPAGDRRIGQPAVLHRVLVNLVTNALKYTNNGTVTVTAEATGDTAVRFQVDDTGRGMPEAVLASLSLASWSGPLAEGRFSGAGLGIGICRRLLADLGSSLSADALTPVGTRVQFTLDLPAP
ncbi:MAG: HAMP domain-containing sensor histidine kinase [Gemmatimonadota bacterium]|nr:HAMP domain-containing sensor histidine kinase [Gemmatimonadota bacterium]